MRRFGRILSAATLGLVAITATLPAQRLLSERADSWQWYVGPQGGGLIFETPSQSNSTIPVVGAHLLVMAKTAGLMLSYEEGIGDNETSAIPSGTGTAISVNFDNIRRFSGILTIFPWAGQVQPFLGVGFGIQQVVNPDVEGVFDSPAAAAAAQAEADDRASAGFISGLGGLQVSLSKRAVLFGQYQIVSSADDKLLLGSTHTLSGGIRIGLGRWKRDN